MRSDMQTGMFTFVITVLAGAAFGCSSTIVTTGGNEGEDAGTNVGGSSSSAHTGGAATQIGGNSSTGGSGPNNGGASNTVGNNAGGNSATNGGSAATVGGVTGSGGMQNAGGLNGTGGLTTTPNATGGTTSVTSGGTGPITTGGTKPIAAGGNTLTGTGGTAGGGVSGVATGGSSVNAGGVATGGNAAGGIPTGGKATGGAAIGGAAIGGAATGGAATGGAATGGAATGGAPTGGNGTGGATVCGTGTHDCNNTCVDNTNVNNCGTTSCSPCTPPSNSTATCDGKACGFTCNSGFHVCGNTCADDTSVNSCGTSCTACSAPANAQPTCDGNSCGLVCNPGYVQAGPSCDIAPPRPVSPLSNSNTAGNKPTFTWQLAPDTDGAHIDICKDRACNSVVTSADVTGSSFTPSAALPSRTLFWRLRGRIGTNTGGTLSATWEVWPMAAANSPHPSSAWQPIVDVNNDGYGDMLVGDDGFNGVLGGVYFYAGGSSGLSTTPTNTFPATAATEFGFATAILGDLDGDGFGDVAIGDTTATSPSGQTGQVSVYMGLSGGLRNNNTPVLLPPTSVGSFGESVAAAGDLNGDGYADLVVGSDNGAFVYLGSPSNIPSSPSISLPLPTGSSRFGAHVTGAGDVNKDGYGDLLVSDPGVGKVYLYLGNASGVGTSPTLTLTARVTGGNFGSWAATAGDVNGDGYADVVIGDYTKTAAYVYTGSSIGTGLVNSPTTSLSGTSSFGFRSACVGDVNGDGLTDVGIVDFGSAAGFIYTGTTVAPAGVSTSPLSLPLGTGGGGWDITGVGDVNGDGFSDVAVASPSYPPSGIRVYIGTSGTIATPTTVPAPAVASGRFGISIASLMIPRRCPLTQSHKLVHG